MVPSGPSRTGGNAAARIMVFIKPMKLNPRSSSNLTRKLRSRRGFTLIENMFACGVVSMFLGGVFALNSNSMITLRMGRDEAAASQVLQQRVEQMRIANWQRITDPTWLRDNVLNQGADGAQNLRSLNETVTIAPYNSATVATNTFTSANGTASAGSSNTSLIAEGGILVTWTESWTGLPNNRIHTRQATAILGKGGVAKY
jgi:type II secretory pathway pseudopilin PulG